MKSSGAKTVKVMGVVVKAVIVSYGAVEGCFITAGGRRASNASSDKCHSLLASFAPSSGSYLFVHRRRAHCWRALQASTRSLNIIIINTAGMDRASRFMAEVFL